MFAPYSRYFHVIVYHRHKKHSLIFIITNMMVTFFPSSWLIIDAVSCNTYKHMHQCLHSHKFLFTFIYVIAKFTHLIKKRFVRWSYKNKDTTKTILRGRCIRHHHHQHCTSLIASRSSSCYFSVKHAYEINFLCLSIFCSINTHKTRGKTKTTNWTWWRYFFHHLMFDL